MHTKEIFTKIWIYPRRVFRFIDQTGYSDFYFLLLMVSGAVSALQKRLDKGIEPDDVHSALFLGLIFGALFGWVTIYIYASFISFTGNWLDGKAKTHRILRTLSYANIPFACVIIIQGIQLYFIKYDILNASFSENEATFIRHGFAAIKTVLTAWTILLYIIGVSEVQRFNLIKSILNLLLPMLIFLIPIALIYFFAMGFHG